MATKKYKVFVVAPDNGISRMFIKLGWDIAGSLEEADLIQFTGGPDVDPSLYNERPHKETRSIPERDKREALIYSWGLWHGRAMAGICRGGQLLNVFEGGKLYQHVDNHKQPHEVVDVFSGESFFVTSTHHQMMIPAENGVVLLEAHTAHRKEKVNREGGVTTLFCMNPVSRAMDKDMADVEAVVYDDNRVLCFQPHPEYRSVPKVTNLDIRYNDYLLEFLF